MVTSHEALEAPAERPTPNGAERVLTILNLLGTYPEGIGLNDLARLVNSPRSSVHRALALLRKAGFIEQDPNSRYRLGYGLLRGTRRGGSGATHPRRHGQ